MRTKILLISLLVGFSVHVFAQDTSVYGEQLPGYKTNFKRSSAGWFINLSAGGQIYNIDQDYKSQGVELIDRVSLIPAFSFGKWCTPYVGFRVKGQGLSVNSYIAEGSNAIPIPNEYVNVHLDGMWNIANYFGVYSPKKLFNFTPYLGMGWAHRFERTGDDAKRPNSSKVMGISAYDYYRMSDAFSFNGGLQFGFRLSSRVNLDFDLGVTYVGDYFDRVVSHHGENDNIVHAMGGLTFKLGKTDFEVIVPMDLALIDDLNSKINALRRENAELSKRPTRCPDCPPPTPPSTPQTVVKNEVKYVPNVVFFRLNSSKIDDNQQISIYNTANFMRETGERIKVIGYADRGTGTSKYNLGLSERRARVVAKELTTRYKIPSERISIEWKGSNEQPYNQNDWNRVVIMSAQ